MENILKYQELDMKLGNLEKSVLNSKERKVMNQMIAYVKEAQNKSLKLENKAKSIMQDYLMLKKEYDKSIIEIKKLTEKESSELTQEEMEAIFNQINVISSDLYMLERNLNIQIVNIKNILKEFEVTKKGVIKAREQHKESKISYENLVNEVKPKMDEIKKEMLSIEKTVDEKMMQKYKTAKHDIGLPVFVKLSNGNCGGCQMKLPSGKVDKLKQDKFIVCEQCGRVIYVD